MKTEKTLIAVVLSGCGFKDGSEIHESVMTLLAIDKNGAGYKCFAPDIPQAFVTDHFTQEQSGETRNVLAEAARIARGDIQPLGEFDADKFDALIFPGGFGAISNLCSFAFDGENCIVNEDAANAIKRMHEAKKPVGALCIAPILLAKTIKGANITIGSDANVAEKIAAMGGLHKNAGIGDAVVDAKNKFVTTPCYMLECSISDIAVSTENLVKEVLGLI